MPDSHLLLWSIAALASAQDSLRVEGSIYRSLRLTGSTGVWDHGGRFFDLIRNGVTEKESSSISSRSRMFDLAVQWNEVRGWGTLPIVFKAPAQDRHFDALTSELCSHGIVCLQSF